MRAKQWALAGIVAITSSGLIAACAGGGETNPQTSSEGGGGEGGGSPASTGAMGGQGGQGGAGAGGDGGSGGSGAACVTELVSAGGEHTCARMNDGTLRCWGHNQHGALGDGTLNDSLTPVIVSSFPGEVAQISAGGRHTCALAKDGALYCWGDGGSGQLGTGSNASSAVPVKVSALGNEVAQVAAGYQHTCARTVSGVIYCWGDNQFGRLGNGTETPSNSPVEVTALGGGATSVCSGEFHTCALRPDGSLFCWGFGAYGQLGDGNYNLANPTPVEVTLLSASVASVSCGGRHTCARLSDDNLYCWGWNMRGQLGDGTPFDSSKPLHIASVGAIDEVAAGGEHTCARLKDGSLQCWGYNMLGQLGDGGTMDTKVPVAAAPSASPALALSAGREHTCAINAAGVLYCWGGNTFGQLGIEAATAQSEVPVPATQLSAGVAAIDTGENYTCALRADGSLACFGQGIFGALGVGNTTSYSIAQDVAALGTSAAAISTGGRHTCVIKKDSTLWCWGYNFNGEIGNGTKMQSKTPVQVSSLGASVDKVSAAYAHTCAKTKDGALSCWGANYYGALGDGTTNESPTPLTVSALGPMAGVVDGGTHRTCATDGGGSLKCWGGNLYGELGDGTTVDNSTPVQVIGLTADVAEVAAGGEHVCARKTDGTMWCWGYNGYGQAGDGGTGVYKTPVQVSLIGGDAAQITAGGEHTCALKKDGSLWCWGLNKWGQLGDGTKMDRYTPTQVALLGNEVAEVRAGNTHTCALKKNGSVWCWGWNMYGELGNGHIATAPPYAFPKPAKPLLLTCL